MNFLRGRLEGTNGLRRVMVGDQAFAAPDVLGGTSDGEILVGIRAEHIEAMTERAPGALAARADVIEPLGSNLLITAVVGAGSDASGQSPQRVKIQTHIDFPVRADQPLWLRPDPDKLRWFDAESGREVMTP
jgi:ABC-type sugar transport system ATPase subunit